MQFLGDELDGAVDALLDVGGVEAGLDLLEALLVDGAGQDGGGGGAVAGFVVGLVGDVLHQTGSDVHGLLADFDCLRDGDSVLGDFGAAVALVDQDVSAAGTEGHLDCVAQLSAAFEEFLASLGAEEELFGGVVLLEVEKGGGSASDC